VAVSRPDAGQRASGARVGHELSTLGGMTSEPSSKRTRGTDGTNDRGGGARLIPLTGQAQSRAFALILRRLDWRTLLTCREVCTLLRDASDSEALWKAQLRGLLRGRTFVPERVRELERGGRFRRAVSVALVDARRNCISAEELSRLTWHARLKAGAAFKRLAGYVSRAPTQLRYGSGGTITRIPKGAGRTYASLGTWAFAGACKDAGPCGRFLRVTQEVELEGAGTAVREMPTMVMCRDSATWGWIMESCYTIATSFPPQQPISAYVASVGVQTCWELEECLFREWNDVVHGCVTPRRLWHLTRDRTRFMKMPPPIECSWRYLPVVHAAPKGRQRQTRLGVRPDTSPAPVATILRNGRLVQVHRAHSWDCTVPALSRPFEAQLARWQEQEAAERAEAEERLYQMQTCEIAEMQIAQIEALRESSHPNLDNAHSAHMSASARRDLARVASNDPSLKTLDWKGRVLSASSAGRIMGALETNTSLRVLNLAESEEELPEVFSNELPHDTLPDVLRQMEQREEEQREKNTRSIIATMVSAMTRHDTLISVTLPDWWYDYLWDCSVAGEECLESIFKACLTRRCKLIASNDPDFTTLSFADLHDALPYGDYPFGDGTRAIPDSVVESLCEALGGNTHLRKIDFDIHIVGYEEQHPSNHLWTMLAKVLPSCCVTCIEGSLIPSHQVAALLPLLKTNELNQLVANDPEITYFVCPDTCDETVGVTTTVVKKTKTKVLSASAAIVNVTTDIIQRVSVADAVDGNTHLQRLVLTPSRGLTPFGASPAQTYLYPRT
jgi:hypothetical protein